MRAGFTIIELLVVVAIIAILAAFLVPVLAQVRESARATDCLTRLHQLWVSANVYKQDEGDYPGALFGYAEEECLDNNGVPFRKTYNPNDVNPNTPDAYSPCKRITADRVIQGFLFPEQYRDAGIAGTA